MKRIEFIKKSLWAGGGLLVLPFIKSSETEAKPIAKLNFKPEPNKWQNDRLSLAWIGHSTILMNFFGKWIVTDPVLFERIGVYFLGTSIGPTRLTNPALTTEEFPKPDLILLSHAHMDHMDYPTLNYFAKKYPNQIDVVVAYLTKDVIDDLPWKSITVIDWNDESNIQGIRIRANETKHFGWRYPWEKDRSRGYMKDGRSFNSYLIDYNGKKVLFGGDTALTEKFRLLNDENIDVAIMPIGAYNPWVRNHCNPEEALKMASEIGAKHFIPIYTKTFKQSSEPFNEAIDWMKKSAPNYNMNIGLEEIGQTFVLNSIQSID
ncbi:MBL fold metallo-hydrolase [Candidatus Nomurabacteria bacterium]|nr:MBL fold metallo-hydrolase [Candidatus Nomurabacteria bacterium]